MLRNLWNRIFGASEVVVEEPVAAPSVLPVDAEAAAVVHVRKHKVHLYKDAKGEWRWKIAAGNNRLIAASSESYKNRKDAVDNVNSITSLNTDLR
jgi:uncharacterized protein YegP (UPF0339 family)